MPSGGVIGAAAKIDDGGKKGIVEVGNPQDMDGGIGMPLTPKTVDADSGTNAPPSRQDRGTQGLQSFQENFLDSLNDLPVHDNIESVTPFRVQRSPVNPLKIYVVVGMGGTAEDLHWMAGQFALDDLPRLLKELRPAPPIGVEDDRLLPVAGEDEAPHLRLPFRWAEGESSPVTTFPAYLINADLGGADLESHG